MSLSRRYLPSHAPGEDCVYGMDFSYVIPVGVGVQLAQLAIFTNTIPPVVSTDLVVGPVTSKGRTVYSRVSGGVEGTDYQLRWNVVDTAGNIWPRTALVLCAQTS